MIIKLSTLKNACNSVPSPGAGWCAKWVTQVFAKCGVSHYGNAEDHVNECATKSVSSIKAGMIVCTDDSPTSKYGHIGIYLGNNTVMDNVGKIRTTTLDYWKSYYSKVTPVKCGWFAGVEVVDDLGTSTTSLKIDGYWGYNTCIALQKYFGTMQDGMVSHQWSGDKNRHKACSCFEHDSTAKGSQLIKAMQKRLGVTQDGLCGKNTINALEKHYGINPDGVLSAPSNTIKAMQKALNEGKF